MKRTATLITILLLFCLAGCSAFGSGIYVSVQQHNENMQGNSEESTSITSYAELCKAMEALIADGQEFGIVYYHDYDETILKNDLIVATNYVKTKYPLGAYALKDITYDTGNTSSSHAIAFTLSYLHSRSEIKNIQNTPNIDSAKEAVYNALGRCDSDLVILIDHYMQTDFVQVIEDYALDYPDIVMETPNVYYTSYPDSGSSRVLEFKFTYSTSRDVLRNMKNTVTPIFSSATLYVSKDAEDSEKYAQLYAFLSQRYEYRYETSITPAYSLLRHGVGDSRTFATVYAAMCRNIDLDCFVVSGTKEGLPHYWNIIFENDRYYHIDLLQCIENDQFVEKTDSEMHDYVWNYSAYPACEDFETDIALEKE